MNREKFFELLGIDLLQYAMGTKRFDSKPPFTPVVLSEIREKIQDLDAEKIDDAIIYSKGLLDEESNRGEKIESKAYNVISVTGLSAAFITGISSLLPKEAQSIFLPFLIILLALYLLIVISLTLTILLASRVVIVGKYKFSYPDITDVFEMGTKTTLVIKKDRLTTYLYCYAKNYQTHNIKASYLIGAQLWFRNSVILFLILAFALIPSFFWDTTNITSNLDTATTTTVIHQQTPNSTPSITNTATVASPTPLQTATVKPSQTYTKSPIILIPNVDPSITVTATP